MDGLHISLFGRFYIQYDQRNLSGFDGCKVQELFCYLLVHPDYPYPREVLGNLLWQDCSMNQSKGYLRKALWKLQSALERQTKLGNGRLLLVELDYVQLNSGNDLWLDVATFETAFSQCRGVSGRQLTPDHSQVLQEAVALYNGCFLEGWYQEWCLYERERLHQMYFIMLDKLMDYCEANEAYEEGLLYGSQILRYDQARERTHRSLMRLHYLSADRTAALRQYERCIAVLDNELDVGPSQQTVALFNQIRNDRLQNSNPTSVPQAPIHPVQPQLEEVHQRLEQVQVTLATLQDQVQGVNETIQGLAHDQGQLSPAAPFEPAGLANNRL